MLHLANIPSCQLQNYVTESVDYDFLTLARVRLFTASFYSI